MFVDSAAFYYHRMNNATLRNPQEEVLTND